MQNEAFLLSPVTADYYCQTVTGLIPATGQRAYVPALPELVFFFEPNQLTEARTGMLFARADLEPAGHTHRLAVRSRPVGRHPRPDGHRRHGPARFAAGRGRGPVWAAVNRVTIINQPII